MWSPDAITDAACAAFHQRDQELREEQSVYGLDSLNEVALHELIARAFELGTGNWAVGTTLREQPYPHEWVRKLRPSADPPGLALPIPRDRQRCDIVLTPEPNQQLDDSLLEEKARRADAAAIQGTLFESPSSSHLAPGTPASPHLLTSPPPHLLTVPPESCFWLELKTVGQFTMTAGLPGPNRTYTSEITRAPISDLKKLASDHRITEGGVLLIVFSADKPTADHDLAILAHRCLDQDLPLTLGGPITRHFPIPDRIGNTLCTTCLIALRKQC